MNNWWGDERRNQRTGMTETMKKHKHLNIHLLVTCFQVAFYAEVQVPFFVLENHAKVFVAVIPVHVEARRRKRKCL